MVVLKGYLHISICIKKHKSNIKTYVGLDQNSFFREWPFLAKKNTLAKLSPCPQKTFVGPYVGLYVGILGRKHGLDRLGTSERLSDHQNSFCGGCTFTCGVLLFTVVLAHLLPPSFQEKARLSQSVSKLSRKITLHQLNLPKPVYVPVIREAFAKKNTLANSGFNFRQRSFWHTKGHRTIHSRQGPLDRHSCEHIIYDTFMSMYYLNLCTSRYLNAKWARWYVHCTILCMTVH